MNVWVMRWYEGLRQGNYSYWRCGVEHPPFLLCREFIASPPLARPRLDGQVAVLDLPARAEMSNLPRRGGTPPWTVGGRIIVLLPSERLWFAAVALDPAPKPPYGPYIAFEPLPAAALLFPLERAVGLAFHAPSTVSAVEVRWLPAGARRPLRAAVEGPK